MNMFFNLSPELKDAIRISISVLLFIALGEFLRSDYDASWYLSNFMQLASWCAITTTVVSCPLIGATAQKGMQRAAGTILGGFIGIALMYIPNQSAQYAVIITVTFVITVLATVAAAHLKADYGGKLCILTYIIVIGYTSGSAPSPLVYGLARIVAVLIGIAATFVAAVVIFPKSATERTIQSMRDVLVSLSDLHSSSWEAVEKGRLLERSIIRATSGAVTIQMDSAPEPSLTAVDKTKTGETQAAQPSKSSLQQSLPQLSPFAVPVDDTRRPQVIDIGNEDVLAVAAAAAAAAADGHPETLSQATVAASKRCDAAYTAFRKAVQAVNTNAAIAENEFLAGVINGHRLLLPRFTWLVEMIKDSWGWVKSILCQVSPQQSQGVQTQPSLKERPIHQINNPAHSSPPVIDINSVASGHASGEGLYSHSSIYTHNCAQNAPCPPGDSLRVVTPQRPACLAQQRHTVVLNGDNTAPAAPSSSASTSFLRAWDSRTICIPTAEVNAFVLSVRHMVRIVWSQHLALGEGFEEDVVRVLHFRYPQGLLNELKTTMQAFLKDMLDTFPQPSQVYQPTCPRVPTANLDRFSACISSLTQISLHQYMEVMHQIRSAHMPVSILNGEENIPEDAIATGVSAMPTVPLPALDSNLGLAADDAPGQGQMKEQIEEGTVDQETRVQFLNSMIRKEMSRIMFPPTVDGHSARLRWHAVVLAMQQLHEEGVKMKAALEALLPLLPGNGPIRT